MFGRSNANSTIGSKSTEEQFSRDVTLQCLQLELALKRYQLRVCHAMVKVPETASFEKREAAFHAALESGTGQRLSAVINAVRSVRAEFNEASTVRGAS